MLDLGFDGLIKVGAMSHPGPPKIPDDFEHFKSTGIPLLINSCEVDPQFPHDMQKAADEILGGGKMEAEGYKRLYFPGNKHGFAVRGDMSQPIVREAKEEAFKAIVDWFFKYF